MKLVSWSPPPGAVFSHYVEDLLVAFICFCSLVVLFSLWEIPHFNSQLYSQIQQLYNFLYHWKVATKNQQPLNQLFYSDQKSADNEIWSQYNQLLYCLKTFKHCRFHCIRIPSGKILFELLSIINTNYICCFYLEVIINMTCR